MKVTNSDESQSTEVKSIANSDQSLDLSLRSEPGDDLSALVKQTRHSIMQISSSMDKIVEINQQREAREDRLRQELDQARAHDKESTQRCSKLESEIQALLEMEKQRLQLMNENKQREMHTESKVRDKRDLATVQEISKESLPNVMACARETKTSRAKNDSLGLEGHTRLSRTPRDGVATSETITPRLAGLRVGLPETSSVTLLRSSYPPLISPSLDYQLSTSPRRNFKQRHILTGGQSSQVNLSVPVTYRPTVQFPPINGAAKKPI